MSRSPPVRDAGAAAVAAMIVAAVMIAQHIAAIATRDAFFLSQFPATDLPLAMIASAGLSLFVVLGMARLLTRLSPARAVPVVFLLSAGLFAGEWLLSFERPRLAAVVAFLHTAAFGAAVISGFWSVIAERFDPYTAKRYIGRIGAGASLGGILGGVLAWQVGGLVSLPVMLAGLGGVNVLCAAGVWRVGAGTEKPAVTAVEAEPPSGYRVMREVPYLRHLAALVILATVAEVTVDYVFKANAAGEFAGGADLVEFFALFYTATGVLGFLVQSGLASVALRRIGLTGTVVSYPITVACGAAAALVFPGLWALTALRGADATLKSSLFRSGYELLYTPLTVDKKRPTKTLIDVGGSRLGGAVGSGIAIIAIAVAPAVADRALVGVALCAAVLGAVVVSRLHRGYVAALADSLRSGAVQLDRDDMLDSVSLKTFLETTSSMNHQDLLTRMDDVRREMGVRRLAAEQGPADVAALTSGDAARIRAVLRDGLRNEVVSLAIPLLARSDLQADVIEALRVAAPRATGLLVDAMLDESNDETIRRRVPRVLSTCATQRAANGLAQGLRSDVFELRRRCGAALKRIMRKDPSLTVPDSAVYEVVRRDARGIRKDAQRLEHVFTLLSLVLDPEPAELAFQALRSEGNLRGVGLEYLDNVLPDDVRDALWPHLPGTTTAAGKRGNRKRADIEDELRSSMSIHLAEIRKELAATEE